MTAVDPPDPVDDPGGLSDRRPDETPDNESSKGALRRRFRAFRESVTMDAWGHWNEQILYRIWLIPELLSAQTVHVYYPMVERREVDTRGIIGRCLEEGKRVVLPVVGRPGSGDEVAARMLHVEYETKTPLLPNRWGVLEPAAGAAVAPDTIDVAIVPAIAVDHAGVRLGYGRGYYDRFLASTRARSICPAFEATIVTELPRDPWDVAVDIVVTESRIWRRADL